MWLFTSSFYCVLETVEILIFAISFNANLQVLLKCIIIILMIRIYISICLLKENYEDK